MTNFRIDFMNQTITMTKSFYKRSQVYGSAECETLYELTNRFPAYRLVIREVPKNNNKALFPTYEKMQEWIEMCAPNPEEAMREFYGAIQMARFTTNAYNHVRKWFFMTYGDQYLMKMEPKCYDKEYYAA